MSVSTIGRGSVCVYKCFCLIYLRSRSVKQYKSEQNKTEHRKKEGAGGGLNYLLYCCSGVWCLMSVVVSFTNYY